MNLEKQPFETSNAYRKESEMEELKNNSISRAFDGVMEHHRVDDGIDALEVMPVFISREGTQIDVALLTPGSYPAHHHKQSTAKIYILKGRGIVMIGEETHEYGPGMEFVFPKDIDHGFEVVQETSFLSIQDAPIKDPETGNIDFHRR